MGKKSLVKFYEYPLLVLLLAISSTPSWLTFCQGAYLRQSCQKDADCLTELSHCDDTFKICTCRPYSIEYNQTMCLQGTLLGFECKTDAQCASKVPTSGCINGICSCEDGYVPYRRHTCLAPSKLGEICFENQQCGLADKGSYCKYVVPRVFGRCQCQSGKGMDGYTKKCLRKNIKIGLACNEDAECSTAHAFCQKKMDGSSVCTCEVAYAPSSDRTRCLPTYRGVFSAASLGYSCHSNIQCQLADPNSICNGGICDCAASNSSCSARARGCHRSTFQCHSDGKCISWYFLCDGKQDCEDGSDEVCEAREKCPDQAFQCNPSPDPDETTTTAKPLPSSNITLISDSTILSSLAAEFEAMKARKMPIKCISRSKICNGVADCDNGSDEEGCTGASDSCPHGTFQCLNTKHCLPEHRFCNAIPDCPDQSDEEELECRMEFQPSQYCPYRCADGRCRSSAIVCSGVQGCSDGSDEEMCQVCRCPRVS